MSESHQEVLQRAEKGSTPHQIQGQMRNLEIGHCYFVLSFADNEGRIPVIETYIFIGTNLLEQEGTGTTWYFKNPDSYIGFGARLEETDYATCIRVGEDTIELVLNIQQLLAQLQEIA